MIRLEEIRPSTPPMTVYQALNHRPADELEQWAKGFHDWTNVQVAHRQAFADQVQAIQQNPPAKIEKQGKGIILNGGGIYLPSAYVAARMIRSVSTLPGQLFYIGSDEIDEFHQRLFKRLDFESVDITQTLGWNDLRMLGCKQIGWLAKPIALQHTKFRHAAAFDADCYPLRDPLTVFDTAYIKHGAIFFPDIESHDLSVQKWQTIGMAPQHCWCFESGQMWIDTVAHRDALALTIWLNDHLDFYYHFFWGDKETFCIAWRALGKTYAMPVIRPCAVEGQVLVQYDLQGIPLTVHRCRAKFTNVDGGPRRHLFWNTEQSGVHYRQFFADLPKEFQAHRAFRDYERALGGE